MTDPTASTPQADTAHASPNPTTSSDPTTPTAGPATQSSTDGGPATPVDTTPVETQTPNSALNPVVQTPNETQVSPDAGTGSPSQTEDVRQQSMASTATTTPNTPLPSTEQAKQNSEILADALNKELGNNVASMVDPTVTVQAKDTGTVPSQLTAVAAALVEAGVVAPEVAAAAVRTASDAPVATLEDPDYDRGPMGQNDGEDFDDINGLGESKQEPINETSIQTPDVAGNQASAPADSNRNSRADATGTPGGGGDTGALGGTGGPVDPPVSGSSRGDAPADPVPIALPAGQTSDQTTPPSEGTSNVQNDPPGPSLSDPRGSGNTAEPAQPSNPSAPQPATDGGSGDAAATASSAKGSSAADLGSANPQSDTLSPSNDGGNTEGSEPSGGAPGATATPNAAAIETSTGLGADSGGNAPGVSPSNPDPKTALPQSQPDGPQSPRPEDMSPTPVAPSDIPDAAVVDSQTGAPTVTTPSTEVNATSTTTAATQPSSTPGEDAPANPVKPTPNDDANAPVAPNTQTTDTPGPAPTLPSSPDPVSADNTTPRSVDSPNPQTENTTGNGATTPVAGDAGTPSVTDVTQTAPTPPNLPVLTDVIEAAPGPTVVNTGVQDSSKASPTPPTSSTIVTTPPVSAPASVSQPVPTPTPPAEATATPATSHGPTGIHEVDRILQHLPASALGPIYAIKNYMTMMAPRKPMDAKTGAQHQVSLFRAMTAIINREEEHFEALFTAMLKLFEHGKDDVFQETHVFRFQESVNLNADEQKSFQRLVNLIKVMGPVQDRHLARKQVRVEESLTHGVSDEGRSRVISYFDPNGR